MSERCPRRIALLIRSLAPGGAERQFVLLARLLRERGHAVRMFTFYGGGGLAPELDAADVEVVSLEKAGRWDVVLFLLRLRRALVAFRTDVLHTYGPLPNSIGVLVRPLIGMTPVVWGVGSAELDWSRYARIVKHTFRVSAWLSRGAAAILVNSVAGIRYHQSIGYPAKSMHYVPNGIDLRRFRPDPVGAAALRQELGLSGTVIGMVGRLDPIKDHESFLLAARHFLDNGLLAHFVVVGSGGTEYADALRVKAQELGLDHRVVFLGHRDDLPALYSAMDLHTLTSRSEGTPNSVGEAMACGVACVVTDVGDAAALVGGTGLVVPPGDPVALARAWAELLRLDPGVRAMRARLRIQECYSQSQFCDNTEAALLKACGGR